MLDTEGAGARPRQTMAGLSGEAQAPTWRELLLLRGSGRARRRTPLPAPPPEEDPEEREGVTLQQLTGRRRGDGRQRAGKHRRSSPSPGAAMSRSSGGARAPSAGGRAAVPALRPGGPRCGAASRRPAGEEGSGVGLV